MVLLIKDTTWAKASADIHIEMSTMHCLCRLVFTFQSPHAACFHQSLVNLNLYVFTHRTHLCKLTDTILNYLSFFCIMRN